MKEENEDQQTTPDRDSESRTSDSSPRIGPDQSTWTGENLEGAPTEDSPAREPTEKLERMRPESPEEEGGASEQR